jgi:hypothetical protein
MGLLQDFIIIFKIFYGNILVIKDVLVHMAKKLAKIVQLFFQNYFGPVHNTVFT